MFTLRLKKDFIAGHQLVGGDWGSENEPHSHHYVLELMLSSDRLDHHGYLVDLVDVEKKLTDVVGQYENRMLNEMPEFGDSNPSLERFSRIIWNDLADIGKTMKSMTVRLWENEDAWAQWSGSID